MSNFTVKMSIYGLFPALFLLQCVFVRVLFSCTPFFLATLSLARLGTLLTNGSCVWGFFGPLVWALRPKGGFLGHNNEFQDEGGGGLPRSRQFRFSPIIDGNKRFTSLGSCYLLGQLRDRRLWAIATSLTVSEISIRITKKTPCRQKRLRTHPLLSDHIF